MTAVSRWVHNRGMNLARARRPASLALAVVASVLLVAGIIVPGLVIGAVAVGAAWLRLPAGPEPSGDSSAEGV